MPLTIDAGWSIAALPRSFSPTSVLFFNLDTAKPSAQRGKNGIMRGMKKNAKHALAFAVAIADGLAAPMRSDAANDTFLPATSHMPGISHF